MLDIEWVKESVNFVPREPFQSIFAILIYAV